MKHIIKLILPAGIIMIVLPLTISAQQTSEVYMESIRSKDGTLIAFQRSGTGPPLVLVHGGTAEHTRWAPVLPALEEHFTVYAIDRRGRGGSGDTEPYTIQREFEDIAAVINSIGEKADLLGHSYGGVCALEAALLTKNIRRLVLYEPAPPGFKENPGTIARMQAALDAGDREGVLSIFFLEVAGLAPAELDMIRSVSSWQGRVAAAHTILRELKSIELHPPFDEERFSSLETPALLLLGGDSISAYKETIKQIDTILPNSRIVVMPDQQHVAMNTAPDLFAREVINFLKQP